MQQRDPSPPPGDRARRRSLFGGRPGSEPPPVTAGLTPSAAERAETVISAYQEMIQEQLDEGLRAIQHSANSLMHEIAAEVWRSAGGDKQDVAATILQELSRDQAIRALIAHADERFQALAARTGRLEDTMNMLAESVRSAREQIARSADALAEHGGSPVAVGRLRTQLDEMTRQVATAFTTLAERDQAIVETVHERIREHGELITHETGRISQAMQEYVQQGVEAMGQLAGSAGTQAASISGREEELGERLRETVERHRAELGEQIRETLQRHSAELGEQLQLLYDRTAITATSLHELVSALGERIGVDTRETAAALHRTLEERVSGLAQLVRSDSEALRLELVRRTAGLDQGLADMLDERLGQAMDQTLSVIDRNMIRMVDALETHFERLGADVGERAANAAELAIGARFDDVLARLHDSAAVIERGGSESRIAMEESRVAMDQRFAALAKLVRSDSERLAQQIVADQDVTKQALRAMKELQASLPAEVIQMVEQRFASLAESIERSNEMLAARIDRMADTIGQRQNDDIQIVIDRMGDAMHALASLGKGEPSSASERRIDID